MSRLQAVVAGMGFIGPVHIEALRRLGISVIGLVASSLERGQAVAARLGIERAYESLDEALADRRVNVVHLATPNNLHFAQSKQVLAAGRHVICEKPLAMTSAETSELVTLSQRSPMVSAVCYNTRFYPLNLEARRRIASGEVGRVYHVTGSYHQDWLLNENDFNWRVLSSESGPLRAVADIGTHWLDLLQFVTGETVVEVCADLRTFLPTRLRPKGAVETFQGATGETEPVAIDTEDYGAVLFRFAGGGSGVFTVSQVTAGRKNSLRYEIAGAKTSLAWDSERPNELWQGRRDQANASLIRDPALLGAEVRPFADYPGGHNEGFPDTFKQLFRAVYGRMESAQTMAYPTFADGHREVLLCEAILTSHRERRWVKC